jgi:hypothetical protein
MTKISFLKGDRKTILQIIALIGIAIAFSIWVIQGSWGPLSGMTGIGPHAGLNHDFVDIQEYKGFYFAKNLSFNPLPHLNLINNQVFYPYGTSSVFNPWAIEGDLVYAALYSLWGASPWLQIYYLLTVLITATGTFFLLRRDYGFIRASGAGILVSLSNFYAINKYPHHLPLSVIHWITLGVIADFLITKRVALKEHVTLNLILVRIGLLLLSFGHDLGYVAGLGLMSLTVSLLFIAGLICYRYVKREFRLPELFHKELDLYKDDFFAHPWTCLFLLGLNVFAGFLYLPLVMQIAREAKSFDLSGANILVFWSNPLRLLLPLFSIASKSEIQFENTFHDSPETVFDGRPGLFLLILGGIGLWQNRHRMIIFAPLLITFALCLLYVPGKLFVALTLKELGLLIVAAFGLWLARKRMLIFVSLLVVLLSVLYLNPTLFLIPTLKLFPWFTFNRVAGRCTILYPTILSLFALHINLSRLSWRRRQTLTGLLVALACIELGTAYSFRSNYQQPEPLNQSFFAYMDFVKEQPGEAVLDWPFCIASGAGAEGICPYYTYNSGVSTLTRFHGKKVMGHYFGRLHSSQVAPYFQAGWDKLFFPDDKMPSRQSRCFNQAEWSFFTDFFRLNDFAGINLYVDRLPGNCAAEFHQRFGTAAVETSVPGAGRVRFIPKSLELRNQVDLALGSSISLVNNHK